MDPLVEFREFIEKELGIKMPPSKVPMLNSRLQRRLAVLKIPTLAEYQKYLFHSPSAKDELVQFVDAVTTNKTDFYREATHFELLVRVALKDILALPGRSPESPLRVWCAGCSSGEEPYTIAMMLAEHGPANGVEDFRILATDISTRVLAHAKTGIYESDRVEPLPVPLRRYLMRSKDRTKRVVRIVPELRKKVSFHRLNFMAHDYGVADTFDVVFFRNVAIYFDKPTQEAVVGRLCDRLRPGGYFFMGQSESLASGKVSLRHVGPSVYRRTA